MTPTQKVKAGACVVTPECGHFRVASPSGKTYQVFPMGDDRAVCTCVAGKHGLRCAHVEAVAAFAAQVLAPGARVPDEKFWARIEADWRPTVSLTGMVSSLGHGKPCRRSPRGTIHRTMARLSSQQSGSRAVS